jgi:hypothetical protein
MGILVVGTGSRSSIHPAGSVYNQGVLHDGPGA